MFCKPPDAVEIINMLPESFITSVTLVSIAEIGDKTQFLAFMLAARYRKALPVIAGVLVATLLNHALAVWVGRVFATALTGDTAHIVLGILFVAIGLWVLIPDRLEDCKKDKKSKKEWGAFLTSMLVFFIAETGDKTQVATMVLGAQYNDVIFVILGTTMGMMLVSVPSVLVGKRLLARISLKLMRYIASGLFIVFGLIAITGAV